MQKTKVSDNENIQITTTENLQFRKVFEFQAMTFTLIWILNRIVNSKND